MRDFKKSARLTLMVIHIFMVLLALLTVTLPWLVTWYTEIMGRSSSLAATVMLTCYPCVPLAAAALISMRRVMLNIINHDVLNERNIVMLRNVVVCCFAAALIMLIAGFFYMPFIITGAAAAACALVVMLSKNLIQAGIENKEK